MTINGAIMELVMLCEHPMMPNFFKPSIQKVIETISEAELVEPTFTADTPQTEETCERCVYVRGSQWCQGCNGTPKRWDGEKIVDTPQAEEEFEELNYYDPALWE